MLVKDLIGLESLLGEQQENNRSNSPVITPNNRISIKHTPVGIGRNGEQILRVERER